MSEFKDLDALLRTAKAASQRAEVQARKEAEAAERAFKAAKMRALREAFDAERFRWFFSQSPQVRQSLLDRLPFSTPEQFRSVIDIEMAKEPKRAKAS